MSNFVNVVNTSRLGQTHLFSLGQAGFIIKSASGQLLGVDMYLSECVERLEGHVGFKRLQPKILDPFDIVFDAIIATHPHLDHYDEDAMPMLMSNSHTTLYASVDCKKMIDKDVLHKENVVYVEPGSKDVCGDFELHFINSDHGQGAPDAVGVIISVDGKNIVVVGDSCLHLDWKDEYLSCGPIDVFIAPINGQYGNLNEVDCMELSKLLQPKVTVPCHFGMFASHGGNPKAFHEIMSENNLPYLFMAMGEKYTL